MLQIGSYVFQVDPRTQGVTSSGTAIPSGCNHLSRPVALVVEAVEIAAKAMRLQCWGALIYSDLSF